MSFPFHRIDHIIALDQQLNSYAMELIAVYLLLCLVVVISFFVIPWVDWRQCETLQGFRSYCRCCSCWCCRCRQPCCARIDDGGVTNSADAGQTVGAGIEESRGMGSESSASPTQSSGIALSAASLDHIVICIKPTADIVDAKLSPAPSYSEFAPPCYEEVEISMPKSTTIDNDSNCSSTATQSRMPSNHFGSTASRASRAMRAIFVAAGRPKNPTVADSVSTVVCDDVVSTA